MALHHRNIEITGWRRSGPGGSRQTGKQIQKGQRLKTSWLSGNIKTAGTTAEEEDEHTD